MADAVIKEKLLTQLHKGPIRVHCDGALRDELGWWQFSKRAVSRAMGSLIKNGEATRSRREAEYMHDDDRPVIYRSKDLS